MLPNVTAESRVVGSGEPKGVGCVVYRHRGRRGSQKPQSTFMLQPVS